ncbi:hypothetical protein Q1695_014779 [Nippostrongylus brasiliensis]|nr:hypothetical protein Q1695_014779 [Nippostrongylus brasiliensis]
MRIVLTRVAVISRFSYELYSEEITMDAVLKNSLFAIIYLNLMIFITSFYCCKKKVNTGEKVEPPKRTPIVQLQPRRMQLNPKEALIKDGLMANKQAYPTMDDIKSDWSDKQKEDKDEKKSPGSKTNERGRLSTPESVSASKSKE